MYISLPIQLITPEAVALGIEPPVVIIAPEAVEGVIWTGKLLGYSGTDTQFGGEYGFPIERDGTTINEEYVPGVDNAIDYAVVPYFALIVIKADGTMWSCGMNREGVLGLGIGINWPDPIQYGLTQIGTDTNWKWVSCGEIGRAHV